MKARKPGKGRAVVLGGDDAIQIDIPARAHLFTTAFLSFWLCGWFVGEASVLAAIVSGGGNLFLFGFLGLWTIGGAFALSIVLWNLAGRERIRVTPDGLRIDRAIPLVRRSRVFDPSHVVNLRLSPGREGRIAAQSGHAGVLGGFDTGMIAFDYGRDTIRFGLDLSEADARHVVESIMPHLVRPEAPRDD